MQSPPLDGYRNMAIDEALLESCASGAAGFPCLRFYAFAPPALSLGFSQAHAGAADLTYCRREGIDLVRRPTGGRAVLHDVELTYAIVARYDEPPFGGGVLGIYRSVARALVAGFGRLGLQAAMSERSTSDGSPRTGSLCFAEPARHEIIAGAHKIVGSALARRHGAFLQHGSIPIRFDAARLAGATGHGGGEGGSGVAASGLMGVLGRSIDRRDLAAALVEGFEEIFGVRMERADLTPGECVLSERLRADRYLTASWTFRR